MFVHAKYATRRSQQWHAVSAGAVLSRATSFDSFVYTHLCGGRDFATCRREPLPLLPCLAYVCLLSSCSFLGVKPPSLSSSPLPRFFFAFIFILAASWSGERGGCDRHGHPRADGGHDPRVGALLLLLEPLPPGDYTVHTNADTPALKHSCLIRTSQPPRERIPLCAARALTIAPGTLEITRHARSIQMLYAPCGRGIRRNVSRRKMT